MGLVDPDELVARIPLIRMMKLCLLSVGRVEISQAVAVENLVVRKGGEERGGKGVEPR